MSRQNQRRATFTLLLPRHTSTHRPASTGTHLSPLHNAQDGMRTAVLDLHSHYYCLAKHGPASTGTHLSPLRNAQDGMRTAVLDRFNTISKTAIQLGHKLTRHLTLVFGQLRTSRL